MKFIVPYIVYASPLLFIPLVLSSSSLRYAYGVQAGNISLILFCLTLAPGIIQRLHLQHRFRPLILTLLPIRRGLGIMMFLFAFIHYLGAKLIPTIQFQLPLVFPLYQTLGFIALTLTLPLFLTSNNWSSRALKKNWKKLHRLTYVIGWLIFGHVLLQGISWQSILIGGLMFIEMISLGYALITRHRT